MNQKMRLGLGVLVVAAIAFLVNYVANNISGEAFDWVSLLGLLVMVVAIPVGLVLIAWGLFTRPEHSRH